MRRAGVVGVVLVTALLGGCVDSSSGVLPSSRRGTTSPAALPLLGTRPTTTSTPAATSTTAPPAPHVSLGSSGPGVLSLQQRLAALGYWLGTPDGTYGATTEQAVYALQKAAGISRDGITGPVTEDALARGVVPQPRSTTGYVIEVDLSDDLLMVVDNGKLEDVLNTSTGGGYWYTSGGVTALAETPRGHFHIYREVDGLVTDSLGQLWRPKFFDGGFAIHGDSYVPSYPASHGCVRVSNQAIDWIWANGLMPVGTAVWVY